MIIAAARVYDHAGRFVDHHQMGILKYNVQLHFFGNNIGLFRADVGVDTDLIEGLNLIVGFNGHAIDRYHTQRHGLL